MKRTIKESDCDIKRTLLNLFQALNHLGALSINERTYVANCLADERIQDKGGEESRVYQAIAEWLWSKEGQ